MTYIPCGTQFVVRLSSAERAIALMLLGAFVDNEHDKGADEGHAMDMAAGALAEIEEADIDHDGAYVATLHPYHFGLLSEWVANTVDCPDMIETDEERATLAAMHERFNPSPMRRVEI